MHVSENLMEQYTYPGQELAFFEKALNWKTYFSKKLKPYIGNRVLEVGSGIGATTRLLNDGSAVQWTLLEPDPELHKILDEKIRNGTHYNNCVLKKQTISDIEPGNVFDTIIYIDVLEHIEDDKREMINASELLAPNGHLLILSPAFLFLFSPFDKAIGHYRRYNSKSLKAIIPPNLKPIRLEYLDTIGFFASMANKLFLKQSYPSEKQISMWDKWMIPVSKVADKIFFHSFGKSIIGVWKKTS